MADEASTVADVVPAVELSISPILQAAAAKFKEELPELLKSHRGHWVLYRGARLLAFGSTKTALYQACRARGYRDDDLYVRKVQEQIDEISVEW